MSEESYIERLKKDDGGKAIQEMRRQTPHQVRAGSTPYHEGVSDFSEGVLLRDNPFKGVSGESEWCDGWRYASAWKKARVRNT